MKHLLTFFFVFLYLTACKKEVSFTHTADKYLESVYVSLKDSVKAAEFVNLDFTKAVQSKINSDTSYLRIPFKGKMLQEEFVLLQTNERGRIDRGRIITLFESNLSRKAGEAFNGAITLRHLSGQQAVHSEIRNGYILAFHQKQVLLQNRLAQSSTEKIMSLVAPTYKDMPEVIVVGYRRSDGGISYGDWINLQNTFGGSGGSASGSGSCYYSSAGGGGGSNTGSSDDTYNDDRASIRDGSGRSVKQDPPILVDFEGQGNNPAIEIESYLKCFSNIPDAGAICSIEIFADIPVDKDPNKLLNASNGSPGHTFLQIKKANGFQSVMQNIGFYPISGWKTILTPAPVEGKFVDNSGHEFNASLQMNITPTQLQVVLTHILYLARFIKYDIDEYNCTDFALDVFNEVRVDKLDVPLYDIPGSITGGGTRTPQGLYNKLKSIQQSVSSEASNISLPGYKGWVAKSSGSCD